MADGNKCISYWWVTLYNYWEKKNKKILIEVPDSFFRPQDFDKYQNDHVEIIGLHLWRTIWEGSETWDKIKGVQTKGRILAKTTQKAVEEWI